MVEGRRGVETLQLERDQDGGELLLEERRRKDPGHEQLHELAVAIDHAEVRDRGHQLGHVLDLLADHPHERPLAEVSSPNFLAQNASSGARLSSLLKGKPLGSPWSAAWRSADPGWKLWLKLSMALL